MKKLWKYLLECSETEIFHWTAFAIVVLIAVVCLIATRAHAQELDLYKGPAPGTVASLDTPSIVCHTKEQIADIAIAGAKSHDDLEAKFKEYHDTDTKIGEPTCVFVVLTGMAFGEHIALPDILAPGGVTVSAFAVHFGNEKGDAWMLWAQRPPTPA
jgi:hypothetical protein